RAAADIADDAGLATAEHAGRRPRERQAGLLGGREQTWCPAGRDRDLLEQRVGVAARAPRGRHDDRQPRAAQPVGRLDEPARLHSDAREHLVCVAALALELGPEAEERALAPEPLPLAVDA